MLTYNTNSKTGPVCGGRAINNGMPGPLTKMLQSLYLDIIHGKVTAYNHWLSFIPYYSAAMQTTG